MVIDLLAASRRPLQKLLHDCRFSEWENIALFLDSGATEAVRWAGGLGYILSELGISVVVDLQAFAPGRGRADRAPGSDNITRGIFLVTTFVWDVEGAVLNAAKTYGLTEVNVACSVSEDAHACHPHASHISEETSGRVSFADISQQLNVTLVRMLKIEAQSNSSRFRSGGFPSDASSFPFDVEDSFALSPAVPRHREPPPTVLVSVLHSPLHMGCFLQCPPCPNRPTDYEEQGERQRCPAFSLASPACAGTFPLRRCDIGGIGGAGAALLSAAAAVEGKGEGIPEGRILAEEVPRDERLRYRLLAHVLAEVLWEQLLLDVSGGGGVFTLGSTSHLIGTTLVAATEEMKRSFLSKAEGNGEDFTGRGGSGGSEKRREAAVVLVDRTLDLAVAASRGGSLLQRILSSLSRTGTSTTAPTSPSVADWSPVASAHQQDVGVVLPALAPGLGVPAPAAGSPTGLSNLNVDNNTVSGGGVDGGGRPTASAETREEEGCMDEAGYRAGMPRLRAMKALATLAWPAPPSLCHPGSAAAERAVHGMACLDEENGQAGLVSALERCISDHGCVPPPRKRRGMGSSIMALVTSLAMGNPRSGGLTGDQVCFRCRGVVQVALAAMEAHQRTSALAGSSWPETVTAERVQRQELRDGGTSEEIMEQLCATLRSSKPTSSGVGEVEAGLERRALLLALRGVSLAGGSIGADEASSFRKAWVTRMLTCCSRGEGSGLPADVVEIFERLPSLRRRDAAKELKEDEEGGARLELEDMARERIQRLREAAGSRSHLTCPALRDLALQPYTFVASAAPGTEGGGQHDRLGEGVGRGGGEEDGWDDWGEEHSDGDGDGSMGRSASVEHTTECDTLVGRLAGLMLDRTRSTTDNTVPDLQESKFMSATSVGLGLLSSGLKKFARIRTGGVLGNRKKHRPTDRAVVVIFVVGGFTSLELAEVNGVVRCAAAAASAAGGPDGVDTEVIVAGTTISTPDIVYHQIFGRPPLEQTYE